MIEQAQPTRRAIREALYAKNMEIQGIMRGGASSSLRAIRGGEQAEQVVHAGHFARLQFVAHPSNILDEIQGVAELQGTRQGQFRGDAQGVEGERGEAPRVAEALSQCRGRRCGGSSSQSDVDQDIFKGRQLQEDLKDISGAQVSTRARVEDVDFGPRCYETPREWGEAPTWHRGKR